MHPIEALQWRYATKSFTDTKVPRETVEQIKQAANLTATSLGLQPVRLVHVTSPALREAMVPHSQPKVRDSSDVFVIAARTDLTLADAEVYMQRIATVRSVPRGTLDGFHDAVAGSIARRDADARADWAARQAYIVLGNLLTVCAMLEVDACPMEGFDPAAIDVLLGLDTRGLTSAAMLAIGERSPGDPLASAPKVRLPLETFVVTL